MYVGFTTHTGQRQQNQDNGLVDHSLDLFAVADGVGGGDSGEVASASVCLTLQRLVSDGMALEQAIHKAHQALLEQPAEGNAGYAASTVVAIQQQEHAIKVAWVGDSRIYLLREGTLYQLSEDHSVVQQIPGLSDVDIQRMRHVLTQAVGVAGENGLIVDSFDVDRHPDDCWLLCTDGLHGVLNEESLRDILSTSQDPSIKADILLEQALSNGADDNVTLIVLQEEGDYQIPPGAGSKGSPNDTQGPKVERRGSGVMTSADSRTALDPDATASGHTPLPSSPRSEGPSTAGEPPWHYVLLGGVLAVLLFIAIIWGL